MEKNLKNPDYFIVGLQKSGTWWLAGLLDSHPQVRCLPNHAKNSLYKGSRGADEGRIFDMLASVDDDGGEALKKSFTFHHGGFFVEIVPKIGKVSKEELHTLVKDRYIKWFEFHNKDRKPIVGDKTVEYIYHLDLLDEFFPYSKKIVIIRDPKDRIVSWHFHQIRKERKEPGSSITDDFVHEYVSKVKKEYQCILDYPKDIHCLTYASLKKSPGSVLSRLLKHLGTSSDPEVIGMMLERNNFDNLKESYNSELDGVENKEDMNFYRKGKVGEWREYLTRSQNDQIETTIGDLERKLSKKFNLDLDEI